MKRYTTILTCLALSAMAGMGIAYAQDETEKETRHISEDVAAIAEYGWDSLKKAGQIVDKGGVEIATVSVHLKYFGDINIEDLKSGTSFEFLKVEITPEHFVEYEMTKEQFQQYIDYEHEKVENYIQMIIDDENLSVTEITHDPSYSTFSLTVEGEWDNVGIGDKLSSLKSYAQLFDMIVGADVNEDIQLLYYDTEGNLISSKRENMKETYSE